MEALDWAAIPSLLRRARKSDARCALFGADHHRYELNPPVAGDVLERFERENGVRLPEDYRAFLLEAGNGGAGPGYGVHRLEHALWHTGGLAPGALARPFSLTRAWRPTDDPMEQIPDSFREGCLALNEHGCGYWSFLVVTGEAAGSVWDDYSVGGQEIEPVAPSFADWYSRWLEHALRGGR